MQFPVASITTSSVEPAAKPFEGRPGHVDPAKAPQPTFLPDHHLAKGSVEVNANHSSPSRTSVRFYGSGGRHDTSGFALAAQTGQVAEAASY
jgi:hypothetical protein